MTNEIDDFDEGCEVSEVNYDTVHCLLCGRPFNDGGGLYCSSICEEMGNPGSEGL